VSLQPGMDAPSGRAWPTGKRRTSPTPVVGLAAVVHRGNAGHHPAAARVTRLRGHAPLDRGRRHTRAPRRNRRPLPRAGKPRESRGADNGHDTRPRSPEPATVCGAATEVRTPAHPGWAGRRREMRGAAHHTPEFRGRWVPAWRRPGGAPEWSLRRGSCVLLQEVGERAAPQRGERPVGVGTDGCPSAPEDVGDLRVGEVGVVAQHDHPRVRRRSACRARAGLPCGAPPHRWTDRRCDPLDRGAWQRHPVR
jgi:hypothetical protein